MDSKQDRPYPRTRRRTAQWVSYKPWDLKHVPLHLDDCWCGKEYRHDWPGKDEGEPHPR